MHELQVQLLVPRSLSVDDGEQLLRLVERVLPEAMPVKCGTFEPLRATFEWDELPRLWSGDEFLWRARRGAADGHVIGPLRPEDRHSIILLEGADGRLPHDGLSRVLRDGAGALRADYGALQAGEGMQALIPARTLEEGLPGLFWANVLGPPYVALFGRETLRAAPAHAIEEVAPDVFYLQLTERLSDVRDEPDRFRRSVEALKDHLGRDAFADTVAPGPRRAPQLRRPPQPTRPRSTEGDPVVDVLDQLTQHAVAAIAEEGWVAPVGMAVVEGRPPEVLGAGDPDPDRARADIEEALRALASQTAVSIAALLTNDEDVLRIDVEVAGETPFSVVRSVSRDGADVRLAEPTAEPRAGRGWVSA